MKKASRDKIEVFVSAGESSSDIHAAHLIDALKKKVSALETFGLGGDALAASGCRLMMHNREFSVGGGPAEIIGRLPKRRQLELALERRMTASVPDCAILVDTGEINLRLAAYFHFMGVPVIYYIPPKVWAWRAHRLEKIAQHVSLVLSILPFEESIYREWEIPFQYVGNPLIDEISESFSIEDARVALRQNGVDVPDDRDVITVLPGSRFGEIQYHTPIFGEAIRILIVRLRERKQLRHDRPIVLVPAASNIDPDLLARQFQVAVGQVADVFSVKDASHAAMKVARVALVKSGTSTLEAALLGVPMVLAYKVSRSSAFLFKHLVRYRGFVGLVNLFLESSVEKALGWKSGGVPVVPELILGKCRPDTLADELERLWIDGPARSQMLHHLARARKLLEPPATLGTRSCSEAAATAIMRVLEARRES